MENIIIVIVAIICILIMLIIGLKMIKNNEPVSFYTTEKPVTKEEITDIKKWNKSHGFLFIAYAIIIFIGTIATLLIDNEITSYIIFDLTYIIPIPLIIIGHEIIKNKYKK